MTISKPTSKRHCFSSTSAHLMDLVTVESMNILGVTVSNKLSFDCHVSNIISSASQCLYALKTLKTHGMPPGELSLVCRSTLISKLVYGSPAWRGFANCSDMGRINAVVKRAERWGIFNAHENTITNIMDKADAQLFNKILGNSNHVLHYLLPPVKNVTYNLRARAHNRTLPSQQAGNNKNFLHRMLFAHMY